MSSRAHGPSHPFKTRLHHFLLFLHFFPWVSGRSSQRTQTHTLTQKSCGFPPYDDEQHILQA